MKIITHSIFCILCSSSLLFRRSILYWHTRRDLFFNDFRLEKLVKDLSAQVASQLNWSQAGAQAAAAAGAANKLSVAGGPITDL